MNHELRATIADFERLLKRRKFAEDMVIALMGHPRFQETGDGAGEMSESKISVHTDLCRFITEARHRYPMAHFIWNRPEFNEYDTNNEGVELC